MMAANCGLCCKRGKAEGKKDVIKSVWPLRDPAIPRKGKMYIVFCTFSLMFVYFIVAICMLNVSVTIPDLLPRVHANYETIAMALSFASFANLAAFFVSSASVRYPRKTHLLYAIGCFISAAMYVILPFTQSTFAFGTTYFFFTLGVNIVNNLTLNLISHMWKDHSQFPIHVVTMGFTFGGFVGPLIAQPFLSKEQKSRNNTYANDTVFEHSQPHENITTENPLSINNHSRIEIPYIICSGLLVICGVVFVLFNFLDNNRAPRKGVDKRDDEDEKCGCNKKLLDVVSPKGWAKGDFKFGLIMLSGVTIFCASASGHSGTIGMWGFTFAIESDLQFSKDEAIYLMSIANLCRMIGRIIVGLLTLCIPMHALLFVQLLGSSIVCVLLSFCLNSQLSMWIILCAYNVISSSLWPSGFAWANRYISPSGAFMGWLNILTIGTDFGQENLIGHLLQNVSKISLMYLAMGCSCLGVVAWVALQLVASFHGDRFHEHLDEDNWSAATAVQDKEGAERSRFISPPTNEVELTTKDTGQCLTIG